MTTATALEWLRSKAKAHEVYTIEVPEAVAKEDGCQPGTYEVHRKHFLGTLPYRMIQQLRRERASLIDNVDMNETLHLGGEYRSQSCRCEFWQTTYKLV